MTSSTAVREHEEPVTETTPVYESAPGQDEPREPEPTEPDPQQPETAGEDPADEDLPRGEITLSTGKHGVLTIAPDQDKWLPRQKAAMQAIGIEVEGRDAVPAPHVWQFLHRAQVTGLDPWRSELSLIKFGDKYQTVTRIDGYRAIGENTGEYRGQVGPQWCGEDGVWKDVWSPKWGAPMAARVGILRDGFDAPLWGTALYDEYVPLVDEWTGPKGNRRRTGRKVPTDRWVKAPASMLGKCAEALGWRRAFPRKFGGVYTHEEMERTISEAREEEERQEAAERRRRYADDAAKAAARQEKREAEQRPASARDEEPVDAEVVEPTPEAGEGRQPEQPAEPEPQVEPTAEPVVASQDDQRAHLLDELAFQVEVRNTTVARATNRWEASRGRRWEDATLDEVREFVMRAREYVVQTLRAAQRHDEADRYEDYAKAPYIDRLRERLSGADEEPPAGPQPVEPEGGDAEPAGGQDGGEPTCSNCGDHGPGMPVSGRGWCLGCEHEASLAEEMDARGE